MKARTLILPILGSSLFLAGCHTDMWRQPKSLPNHPSTVFEDGLVNRPLEQGVVVAGEPRADDGHYTGYVNGVLVDTLPATLELNGETLDTKRDLREVLDWGRERYDIFCSHCHGKTGEGDGMITQRGLVLRRVPASYHTDRLRNMPVGHFYDVITNGYGIMFAQASRVPVDDRWAIAAYIRALQASHDVDPGALTPEQRQALEESMKPKEATETHGGAH